MRTNSNMKNRWREDGRDEASEEGMEEENTERQDRSNKEEVAQSEGSCWVLCRGEAEADVYRAGKATLPESCR